MKIIIIVVLMGASGDVSSFQIPKRHFTEMAECERVKDVYMEGLRAVEGYSMNPDLGSAEGFCTLFPTWYLRKFD